jgi:hypothetical protein
MPSSARLDSHLEANGSPLQSQSSGSASCYFSVPVASMLLSSLVGGVTP